MAFTGQIALYLMHRPRLKRILVLVATAVLLVVGSCYLTWQFARSRLVTPVTTFAQRDYPPVKFNQTQLVGSLRTESQSNSDRVRYQLRVEPASQDAKKTFAIALKSPLHRALRFSVSLQDAAGFTLCEHEVYRDELVGRLDDGGEEIKLTANGDFGYCRADLYSRVTRWSISSNYGALVDAVMNRPNLKNDEREP